ncbi:MAG: S41 family peptidase [Chitinophagales bacterium]|nr:S41 family peptidase [Chitinophagales bacterium]MCZ2394236.1 S41 family peptidase [Chitinophagales bacterium]
MNRKFSVWLAVVMFLLTGINIEVTAKEIDKSSEERYSELAKNIEIFVSLYRELNSYYVDDLDPNVVMKYAIDGMLENLDPYTNYIPASDIDEFEFQTTGKYGGIGATIGERNGQVFIRQPYFGFPAQKVGLMAGDVIIEVEGVSANNKNSEDIRQLLKGQPNTPLSMKVRRAISNDTLSFKFNREEINIDNVPYYGVLDNNVGYIRLDQFTEGAAQNVSKALKELKANTSLSGLIFDLRGNPGGLLNEAVGVCNVFLDKGLEVVATKGKVEDVNKSYTTMGKAIDTQIPLVVLTDDGSASASEIVSGVIQDYDRGVVMGQRTFGKGLVQIPRPLPYRARLKVTAYKYYIPSGRCIQSIDYSNHNEDGSTTTVPDSLRKVFYTKAGRPVKDGAGIEPDVHTKQVEYSPITISLFTKDFFFDYANVYRASHQKIDTNKIFTLSDEDYQKFISFLSDKKYDYTTKTEKMLNDLVEVAKNESYFNGISDALKVLETNMKHDKEQDLSKHKDEIKVLLESEIATRYLYQKGRIQVDLNNDQEVKQAIGLLQNKSEYNKILSVTK